MQKVTLIIIKRHLRRSRCHHRQSCCTRTDHNRQRECPARLAEYAKYDDMGNRIDVTPTKVVPEATEESESKLKPQKQKPAELTLNLKAQSIV